MSKSPEDSEQSSDGEVDGDERAGGGASESGQAEEDGDSATADDLASADEQQSDVASEGSPNGSSGSGKSSVPAESSDSEQAAGDVTPNAGTGQPSASETTGAEGMDTEGTGSEPAMQSGSPPSEPPEDSSPPVDTTPADPPSVEPLPELGAEGIAEWTEVLSDLELTIPMDVAADQAGNAYVLGDQYTTRRGDMRLIKFTPDGSVEWSQLLLDDYDGQTYAGSVVVAPDGAIYATGSYGSCPSSSGVINKYDAEGTLSWSQQIQALDGVAPMGVAADAEGGVVVTGATYVITDGSAGAQQSFLTSYGADGEADWTQIWDTDDIGFGSGVAISEAGHVFITGGYFSGGYGHFVGKFDREGNPIWEQRFETSASGWDVAVDAEGRVYAGASSEDAAFLQAFDPDGEVLWTQQWSGSLGEFVVDVALDAYGNVFAASTVGSFDRKAELRKFDAAGNLAWMEQWETDGDFTTQGLAVAGTGHLFVTGSAQPTAEDAPYRGAYLRRFQ